MHDVMRNQASKPICNLTLTPAIQSSTRRHCSISISGCTLHCSADFGASAVAAASFMLIVVRRCYATHESQLSQHTSSQPPCRYRSMVPPTKRAVQRASDGSNTVVSWHHQRY